MNWWIQPFGILVCMMITCHINSHISSEHFKCFNCTIGLPGISLLGVVCILVGVIIHVIGGGHNGGYDELMNWWERWIDDFRLFTYWWGWWVPVLLTSKSPFILGIVKISGNIYHYGVGTLVGIMSFCYILHFWLWVYWWVWWAMYFVVGIMVGMTNWGGLAF